MGEGGGSHVERLMGRLGDRSAVVAVVGLGYIGLPLARAVHGAGFSVIGFDTDPEKIEKLGRGEAYIGHLGEGLTRELAASDRFRATGEITELAAADVVVLCVPTPLVDGPGGEREPDLSYVLGSALGLGSVIEPGRLVVLESTTYPGTTREQMSSAIVEAAGVRGVGLMVGEDLFVAFSPEREDPGRAGVTTSTIPKLVGGVDAAGLALASAFYRCFVESVHEVSSAEVAEAAKLLENIYRAVNIALVNELKVVFEKMGIDVWEVVAAAATKPFGFEAFYPGPGLGGHCIPIDPFYLAWKAREAGHATRFVELAGEINSAMPGRVVERVVAELERDGAGVDGARVLLIGAAYKKNVDDIRETPAAEIWKLLSGRGAVVSYHDPHVPVFPSMRHYGEMGMASVALTREVLAEADCVVIVTDHDAVDWALVGDAAKLVVDTRNAMAGVGECRARVVKA